MKKLFGKKKEPSASSAVKLRRRKALRRVSVSTAGVLIALAVVILLNLVCTSLTDRYDLTLDLTAGGLYEITDDTQEMLREMQETVSVTVLMDESDFQNDTYYSKVHTLLNKYANLAGDKLEITYINPYTNPNAVNQYSDLATSIQEGSVILSCGDNTRVLNATDFYATEYDYYGYTSVTGFQGEQALTSAILTVTSEDTPAAYVLQGHSESISTTLSTLLTSAGFTIETLNLTESDIPDDASLLIASLPQTDYSEDEVNAIDAFIKGGGDLLFFDGTASPTELPVLYAYLREWGADVQADMVLDAQYNISDAPDILAELTDSSYNDDLSDSDAVLVTPNAKSISLTDTGDDRTIEAIMQSRDTSYSKVLTDETQYDSYDRADGDTDGPFTLAALASYTGNDDGGQVFICSAALMMSDDLMNASSLMNHDFLRNVVSVMQPDREVVSIPAKSMQAEPLVAGTTATFILFLILALIPLALFVCAAVVFFRRRRM